LSSGSNIFWPLAGRIGELFMSDNRELTMDDYLAMVRRRLKVILIPALLAPVAGFLVSYSFSAKYTSTSTVLVEHQKVPDSYVQSVITSDFLQRIQTLSEEVLSPSRLRPVIHSLALVKPEEEEKLIAQITPQTLQVVPVITSMTAPTSGGGISGAKKKKPSASDEPAPGFTVSYTDSDPKRAQKICNAMTSLILDENLRSRAEVAQGTTEFLGRQLDDAKRSIDEQDAKLAAFKRQYMGQLPGDADNNMRTLMSLNSQLDTTSQTLSRAQQDKTYTESMLAQQTATWKSSQSSTNPQTLEQQLNQLQANLLQLQGRYTADHPDVIKTKADIAEVQKKLKELNSAAATATPDNDKASAAEPAEIRQLRLQIHQYQGVIDQATSDQKRLQAQINVYQSRAALSPNVEEQYKLLTRDDDNAQNLYKDLLDKKNKAELGTNMENQQQGEQMKVIALAGTPDSPSFPNRQIFAAGGFGAGLALGLLLAIWLEFSDKSIRTERDAAAVMDLPLLISVPWLGGDEDDASSNGNGRRRFWGRGAPDSSKEHDRVGV
jgi:uncharacterized protein involved in exopolysaccharide biosynthesis